MTVIQWMEIAEAYKKGNQRPFSKAYKYFHKKLKPQFENRFHFSDLDFDAIFNEKILEILNKTISNLQTFRKDTIDGLLHNAVYRRYCEIVRQKKARLKGSILESRDDPEFIEKPLTTSYEEEQLQKKEQIEKEKKLSCLDKISDSEHFDEINKAIIKGRKVGKTYRQIMKDIGYKATPEAFHAKARQTFRKFRKLYFLGKLGNGSD